jgi:hypothetical protein
VAAVAAVTACGSATSTAKPSAPDAAASPSKSARHAAEHAALAAYRGMWTAFVQAGRTSNPDDPRLSRYATGDALHAMTSSLADDRQHGYVSKGTLGTHPAITTAKPAQAPSEVDIRDCLDDRKALEYHKNGEPVDNTPGGLHRVSAVVQNVGGWKVTSFAAQGVGTCTL